MREQGFETRSVRMERLLQLSVLAPRQDVDRIMEHVCVLTPLARDVGYDRGTFRCAPAVERYRSPGGAGTEAASERYPRPDLVEITFELPDEQILLEQVIEAVYQVHSDPEPVIKVQALVVSRAKGGADPWRWNANGDWKQHVDYRPSPGD